MSTQVQTSVRGDSLADILERILDKGLVIAGDITISIAEIDLLKIKIRLLVCSVDKAREIGVDWWQSDPALSSKAREQVDSENKVLKERIAELEQVVRSHMVSESRPT
ncbi:MAG TPA: gas vesicle protein [Oculatellaceae cyanobacterium]